jgi:hypothetical protein
MALYGVFNFKFCNIDFDAYLASSFRLFNGDSGSQNFPSFSAELFARVSLTGRVGPVGGAQSERSRLVGRHPSPADCCLN